MKRAVTLTVVLLLGIGAWPVSAAPDEHERPTSRLWDATDISCRRAIEQSTSLNGPQLFRAAEACARDEQSDDTVFLLLAGQVRALTDMSLLAPRSEPDEDAAAELYGALYYKYGGSGPDELFRNADRATAMFERLRTWQPAFSESYTPGWRYKPPVESDRYHLMVDYSIRSRLAKLETYKNLIEDDRYYAVHRERQEILDRNDNRIVADTDDADRIGELDQIAATIARSIPRVPEPPLPKELRPDYGPNPNAQFEQLHAGFNGIEKGRGFDVFDSRADALGSWLSGVMSTGDLQDLLEQVDFEQQSVVVMRFSPADSANGKLYIRDIEYRARRQSMSVSGVVGVNEEDCEEPKARSYPFVIAATPKPTFEVRTQSTFVSAVPEGCRPSVGIEGPSASNRDATTTTGKTRG